MSWLRHATIVSLCKLNPDHQIDLVMPRKTESHNKWDSGQRQDFDDYDGRDYLPCIAFSNFRVTTIDVEPGNAVQQCDWFKWRELSERGGWFSDMDIVYAQPLPECDADVLLTYERGYYSMGLLASSGRNALFREVYEASLTHLDPRRYESTNQTALCAVARDINALRTRFPDLHIENLPAAAVYPFPYQQALRYFKSGPFPDGAIGLHWYAGTAEGHRQNQSLNAGNASGGLVQDLAARMCA